MLHFQVDSCDRFWFQPKNERERLERYHNELNSDLSKRFIKRCYTPKDIEVGQVVAVLNDNIYVRGKVIHIVEDIENNHTEKNVYQVREREIIIMLRLSIRDGNQLYTFEAKNERAEILAIIIISLG